MKVPYTARQIGDAADYDRICTRTFAGEGDDTIELYPDPNNRVVVARRRDKTLSLPAGFSKNELIDQARVEFDRMDARDASLRWGPSLFRPRKQREPRDDYGFAIGPEQAPAFSLWPRCERHNTDAPNPAGRCRCPW